MPACHNASRKLALHTPFSMKEASDWKRYKFRWRVIAVCSTRRGGRSIPLSITLKYPSGSERDLKVKRTSSMLAIARIFNRYFGSQLSRRDAGTTNSGATASLNCGAPTSWLVAQAGLGSAGILACIMGRGASSSATANSGLAEAQ